MRGAARDPRDSEGDVIAPGIFVTIYNDLRGGKALPILDALSVHAAPKDFGVCIHDPPSDDDAGLALAAMLLGREPSAGDRWGELEKSAVVETTNIIGCAYVNAMAKSTAATTAAMPSPPWFLRDFAPAVMQSIVMAQPTLSETVFLTRTEFAIEGSPARCSLVFLPTPDQADLSGAAG